MALVASWFYLVLLDYRLVCDHKSSTLWHLDIVVGLIVLIVMAWSIRFTHSITGPNAAAEGAIPQKDVRFRKRDKLQSLETV